jgi:flagellar biosynthesis protein FlhB
MEEDESQKIHEPTPRKLEEARKKGDVAKSQDVATLFVLTAGCAVLLTMGLGAARRLGDYITAFLSRPHEIAVDGGALSHLALDISLKTGLMVAAAFAAMSVAALAGHFAQTGFLVTTEKMKPKLDKISPIKGFKRLFGMDALVQFLKTIVKLSIVTIVAVMILLPHWERMHLLVQMEPAVMVPLLLEVMIQLCFALLIVIAVGAGADYMIQRFQWIKRNKMSQQELKDEYKQTEGSPEVKAKLRQIRMERGRRRMMAAVPDATVVVMNPTHYAVALKYVAGETAAPVCVAKGLDRVALKIKEIALEAEVPVIEDPPLARALYATTELDRPIPVEHYEAVAKIIGVILGVAAKAKSRNPAAAPPPRTGARPVGAAAQ